MIQRTFQILDRVGEKKEQQIWAQGILTWNDFLDAKSIKGISPKAKGYFDRKLQEAKGALRENDSSYFSMLPPTEAWRLYDFFREEAVFLDIETEGMGKWCDITVIGLFDGINTKTMIKGVNLDYRALKKELNRYKLIITFNGSTFDLPFIRKRYDILPPVPHVDLRHLCARVGLKGGLKEIEKGMEIRRSPIIEKFHGGDALTLWRMFRACGDEYYLKLLVEYNEEDVISLKKIMEFSYRQMQEKNI